MRTILAFSAASLFLAVVAASAPANVLTDPGFEFNPIGPSFNTVLNNFPLYQNQWGPENGSIVGVTNGITPASGSLQLEFQPSGVVSQTGQVVDISSYAALVDAGNAQIQAGAVLNSNAPSAIGGVYTNYFTGNTFGTLFGPTSQNVINLDASNATWEPASFTDMIPAGTRWIVFQIGFDSNSISNSAGITTGGYADDAYVEIRAVPEPASLSLLAGGALLLVRSRRRH